MAPVVKTQADRVVADWRSGADSPAGPLFVSGKYAEADITQSWRTWTVTGYCGTACTASATRYCC